MLRLVVFASGTGSNLQALLNAIAAGELDATIVAVVSDHADAGALTRARDHAVPAFHVGRRNGEPRTDYDARLVAAIDEFQPHYVVLAGWMRLLTMSFLGAYPYRVINLHPARPGELPGTNAIARAFDEFEQGMRTSTGVMVHLVPDEGVDDGPVLATVDVPIKPGDTIDSLATRVHAAEHRLLVTTLATLPRPSPRQPLEIP